jgi:hypothetical protein
MIMRQSAVEVKDDLSGRSVMPPENGRILVKLHAFPGIPPDSGSRGPSPYPLPLEREFFPPPFSCHIPHSPGLSHPFLDYPTHIKPRPAWPKPGLSHTLLDYLTLSWTIPPSPGLSHPHQAETRLAKTWTIPHSPGLSHALLDYLTLSWTIPPTSSRDPPGQNLDYPTLSWTIPPSPGLSHALLIANCEGWAKCSSSEVR